MIYISVKFVIRKTPYSFLLLTFCRFIIIFSNNVEIINNYSGHDIIRYQYISSQYIVSTERLNELILS